MAYRNERSSDTTQRSTNVGVLSPGDDTLMFNVTQDEPVSEDLGTGDDTVIVSGEAPQVRVTFTSAEVGNGNANDSNTMANQDGGLAVRLQAENGSGALVGGVSRFDDEGITFESNGNFTFDVRDLVSGVGRGDQFDVVRLGTNAADSFDEGGSDERYYINAGMGADSVFGGRNNDFLVGGAGDDFLVGRRGDDSFIGGGGNDRIVGGEGRDTAIFNVLTDGVDSVDLGEGMDAVNVAGAAGQVRIMFTSTEVGNGNAVDAGTMANQDGGLAVRLQAEDGSDMLVGGVSRFDDEGISFRSTTPGMTFDVRDLVSGVARGDQFDVVTLGTSAADTFDERGEFERYYINAGMGNDTVYGGENNDFLVGGAGDDGLFGRDGDDSFIGGGGNDQIRGGAGRDLAIFNVLTDGTDRVDLGEGNDTVNVAGAAGQVRLTFTSAEVGNNSAQDSGTLANQDGELAVRLQTEDGSGMLTGGVSRFDDEGVTFVSTTPGLTFDVRDLVSGVGRGDQFDAVTLGTSGDDLYDFRAQTRSYYVNGGMGSDRLIGGSNNDFLVGGAGVDFLYGRQGNDSFIGGGGDDRINGGAGNDRAIINLATDGADQVDLGTGSDTVSVTAAPIAGQVRLMFTSAEVGNDNALDAGSMANQDGGLAVRMQNSDGAGGVTGPVSRFDDEGITFVAATPGAKFEVMDLVSGVSRGNQFDVVTLGTSADDTFNQIGSTLAYYINGGMGNDTISGGRGADFLVGGAGDDVLNGRIGNDSYIGGMGADTFVFANNPGTDRINDFMSGTDTIDLSFYGIGFEDVSTTMVGADTVVDVDINGDDVADFQIILVGAGAPVESDYFFG